MQMMQKGNLCRQLQIEDLKADDLSFSFTSENKPNPLRTLVALVAVIIFLQFPQNASSPKPNLIKLKRNVPYVLLLGELCVT